MSNKDIYKYVLRNQTLFIGKSSSEIYQVAKDAGFIGSKKKWCSFTDSLEKIVGISYIELKIQEMNRDLQESVGAI